MEYCAGYSLQDLVELQGVDLFLLRRLVLQLCKALEAIHEHGIIHRDLKPSNVLVNGSGQLKLTDFGIAHLQGSKLTGINEKLGCLDYMAPEILAGGETSKEADYYALGILIYQLFSGRKPFDSPELLKLIDLHLKGHYHPLKGVVNHCPLWLSDLVDRLLRKDPRRRLTSADEVRRAFTNNRKSSDTYERLPAVQQTAPEDTASSQRIIRFSTASLNTFLGDETSSADKEPLTTIKLRLPRDAALVFELEPPSREVIYFGIFLGSLQVLDGLLTSEGLKRFGIEAEGNPLLRGLMQHVTPDQALFLVKSFAVLVVIGLTLLAKRAKFVKDVIGVLSCIYLCTAIIPWLYILIAR